MEIVEFLRKILPEHGLYVIDRPAAKRGFLHQVCASVEEAAMYAKKFNDDGCQVFHANGAFRAPFVMGAKAGQPIKQVRVQRNVRALKSFWMDLDVDPANDKKYPDQLTACKAAIAFCDALKLPYPMFVNSGWGVHIYWSLDHEIIPEQWQPIADTLKQLAAASDLHADQACTSDSARVLRPIGTTNRKVAADPRLVVLLADSAPIIFADFRAIVLGYAKDRGIKIVDAVQRIEAPKERLNQEFEVQQNFPPCSGVKVAERCAQLRAMRDTRGNIREPHWYAAIQLLCHSIEGDPLIHEWSSGYAGYSAEETDRKISQIRGGALGPTLCSTFASRNPGGCDGCPFLGKISSPVQLGAKIESAPAPVIETVVDNIVVKVELPSPPDPFTRRASEKEGEGGIFIEEEGITHEIYKYDCYPIELAYDEQLGYETVRIRHYLPQDGWKECVLQSSLLAKPVDFEVKLRDNHIKPLLRIKMASYFDSYMRKLQTDTKMRQLFKAQGWKNQDTEFVLGDKLYRSTEVVRAGVSAGATRFLEHFQPRGTLAEWRDLTSLLDYEKFAPHMFMLLLAFAAPLLKLDNRQGFTVSALGETGAGKSTMGKFFASVYGHPDQTWIMRGSTANARAERIGAYHSLPAYMDEITTISPKEIRDLVYLISTGKWRESLTRDRNVREGAEWSTILMVSTNDSLQSKLQIEKANAEAEAMRLFEFNFPRVPGFDAIAADIHTTLADNYGVAGPEFIKRVVVQRAVIKVEAHRLIEETARQFGMDGKERFWSQAVALALYAGELAHGWDLIDFDPERMRPWLLQETKTMRTNLAESTLGPIAILSNYLNEHIDERLVVTAINEGMTAQYARPIHKLSSRYEKDTNLLWIDRKHIKTYMDKGHFNYHELRAYLCSKGVIVGADAKKVLGAGTDMVSGQVPCWCISTCHPEMAGIVK